MKVLMPTHIVEYEYDKNRVTKQIDLSGIQKFTYGNFGEVERVQRTVNAPDGMVYNFDMKYAYDLWGRILFIDYPDNERVVYGYDEGGMLRSVKSTEMDYIKAITYDHYGNRTKVLHGNDVETDYFYSLQQRLRVMTLRRPTQELFMQNRYSYTTNSTISQVKNEVSLADDLDVGGVSDWKYTYDDFNRLKSSNASWEGKREKHSYTLAMTYNNTHGITKKTQTHKVENLYTNQVSNTANYYTGTYQYQNTLKPHTVSKINYVKPGGVSSMLELTYDLNGNVRSKTHTVGNQTSGWHLFWDEQDRLRGALEGGYLQYYVYDAGGERIIKSRGSVQNLTVNGGFVTGMSAVDGYTLYPNGYITLRDGVSTKHYYADSQRIASKIGDEGSIASMVIMDLGADAAVFDKNVQSMTEQLEEIVGEEDFVVMAVPTNPAERDHLLYDILKRLEGARKFDCIDRINQIRAQQGPCAAIEYYENSDCYISPCEQEYDQWLAFLDEHNKTDCKNKLIRMVEREGMRKCEAIDKMRATTDCFDIPDETLCYLEIIRQYEHCIATNSASLCLACFEEFLSGETTGYCRMLADLRESRCWTDIIPVEPEPEPEYPDVEEPIVEPEVPSTEIDPVIPDEPVIPEQPHISGKIWWYHSDHLGSSSYITDILGKPVQYYEYLPFGEIMVQQSTNNIFENVYKFNGKELDEQTGYYYYGARYYDPGASIFLSVDPHAERYPSYNPYVYTFNDPINHIDPDGRDGVRVIDRQNKTITIKATYFVQTEGRPIRGGQVPGYSSSQISSMSSSINNWYNEQNLSVNEGEFEGYNIRFDLTFKDGGNSLQTKLKSNAEQYEGHSVGNSLERGSEDTHRNLFKTEIQPDGSINEVGGVTERKKSIMMNSNHDNGINRIHEVGHTLGLDDNKNTGNKGGLMEYPPGNMTQKEANQLGNSGFLPKVE